MVALKLFFDFIVTTFLVLVLPGISRAGAFLNFSPCLNEGKKLKRSMFENLFFQILLNVNSMVE